MSIKRGGFTLIELLIYISIFVLVVGMLTGILLSSFRSQERETASAEVSGQLDLILSTTQRLVRDSSLIDVTYEGYATTTSCSTYCTLLLRMEDSSLEPTIIRSDANGVYVKQGSGAEEQITSDKVSVDYLRFNKFEIEGGHAAVQIDASLSFVTNNPRSAITKTLQSAISRVTAATFDSDLIPNANNSYSLGQISPDQQWKDARLSGDLSVGGNISVGSTSTISSAIFSADSTSKGFLPPRMTTTQRNSISSPATGLLIYNTTTGQYEFYDGSSWSNLGGSDPDWTVTGNDIYNSNSGNVGVGTNDPDADLHVSAGTGIPDSEVDIPSNITALFETKSDAASLQLAGEDSTLWMAHIVLTAAPDGGGTNKHWLLSQWGPYASNRFSIGYKTTNGSEDNWGFSGVTEHLIIQTNGIISGTFGTYHSSSDARNKVDVQTIPGALDKVSALRGVNFHWKEGYNTEDNSLQMGLIAQEVEKVVPEVVHTADDQMRTKAVQYENLVGLLVEAIKELRDENNSLKKRVEALEN